MTRDAVSQRFTAPIAAVPELSACSSRRETSSARDFREALSASAYQEKGLSAQIHDGRQAGGAVKNNNAYPRGEENLRHLSAMGTFDVHGRYHSRSSCGAPHSPHATDILYHLNPELSRDESIEAPERRSSSAGSGRFLHGR